MIAAGRDEEDVARGAPAGHVARLGDDVEAEDADIEIAHAVDVGGAQMNVPDPHAGIDRVLRGLNRCDVPLRHAPSLPKQCPMKAVVAVLGLTLLLAAPAEARLRPAAKLTAKAGASTVRLAWKDRARGETRYEVRRRGRKVRLRANRKTWTDRRVAPATRYRYTVRPCKRRRCARGRSVTITTRRSGRRRRRRTGRRRPAAAPGGDPFAGSPMIGACPVFPRDNPWNTDVSQAPVDTVARLRRLARLDDAVARLRRRRRLRHPVRQRPLHPAARPRLLRRGRRVRSRPLPHAARRPRRGWRRPPRADAAPGRLQALRAVRRGARRAAAGTPTAAPPGTCAPTRCARSAGPRRTPPGCRCSPASRAATRPTAASSATRCGSPSRTPSAPTSTRPRTGRRRAPTPRCRRWACACG